MDTLHQEISHVFHCMQCDLQFQIDVAVNSREESHEIDGGILRIRLDPRIRLECQAEPQRAAMRDGEEEK